MGKTRASAGASCPRGRHAVAPVYEGGGDNSDLTIISMHSMSSNSFADGCTRVVAASTTVCEGAEIALACCSPRTEPKAVRGMMVTPAPHSTRAIWEAIDRAQWRTRGMKPEVRQAAAISSW
jgi:hypothetical protein